MSIKTQALGIVFLYCVVFAWLSVPFVTTDKDMLRKQILFVDKLQEKIDADAGAQSAQVAVADTAAIHN